jgi:chemotaxis signal transduction protein
MVEAAPKDSETEEVTQVVILRAGSTLVAVDALKVVEVVVRGPVTRVPYSPSHFLGLCIVAGRLVPVFALRSILGLETGPPAVTLPRLVILKDSEHEIAFVCEEARGVVPFHGTDDLADGAFELGHGTVDDEPIVLLDTDALLRAAMAHTKEGERQWPV